MNLQKINKHFQTLTAQHSDFAAQVCLYQNQSLILNECYGNSAYTIESPMLWMSAGKPLTAALFLSHIEKQNLSLTTRVAEILPDFAANGKEVITFWHLLTHTGGFRGADMGLNNLPFERAVTHVCQSKLEPGWTPGEKAGYHINSSWLILAAILEKITENSFESQFRQFIETAGLKNIQCQRTGMDEMVPVYNSSAEPVKPEKRFNPEFFKTIRPGSNITGPASELAGFYQQLLYDFENLGLSKPTRDSMISRQRKGMLDATFRAQMDWGLGVIINTFHQAGAGVPYGFGPHASADTVGHGGSQCSVGFMDTEKKLTGAVIFNDMPGEAAHQKRIQETMKQIYESLGLAE